MKAIILTGKEKDSENYQLVINTKSISINYNEKDGSYIDFLNKTSEYFAKVICVQKSTLELGVLNGFKMDSKGTIKIEKLDNKLFESLLTKKLTKFIGGNGLIISSVDITN